MPATDPNWLDGATGVSWAIDVDGDATTAEYSAELTADANGDLVGDVISYVDDNFCSAQRVGASLSAPHYTFLFEVSCIGSPASFSWGAVMVYDTNPEDPDAPVGLDAVPDGEEMDVRDPEDYRVFLEIVVIDVH